MDMSQISNAPAGRSLGGYMQISDLDMLNKALTAGYGTDVAGLEGGAALRIQSLDKTLMAVIQENKHFALFNTLNKQNAIATVDEWTEQSGIGGFLGGSTNSELGIINEATGEYARRTGFVKYLMTKRSVSLVQTLQGVIADAEATEHQNGAKQLLSDAEFLSFEGDSDVVTTEFDGIGKLIKSLDSVDHVIDLQGASLTSVSAIVHAAATIGGYGNFGTPTHLFYGPGVGADMDVNFDPAYRVPLANGNEAKRGTPLRGIVTAQGDIEIVRDVFIRDETLKQPFQVLYPAIAAANDFVPAAVVPDADDDDASSQFTAPRAGNYYYMVAGVNEKGQSVGLVSAQIAIAAGKKCVVTITKSTSGTETGYVIYRSRLNGTNAPEDLREMARIPRTGTTTVYTDLNRDIPGCSTAYMLNMTSGDSAITWRQLLPMMKFPLATTNQAIIPWAQLLFGYLRITKRRHHVVIKNILPSQSKWKPFG